MLPVLQIGPFALQAPGLILLLGIWIGLWLSERHAPRYKLDASTLYNLVLVALLIGLLGGRLFFIIRFSEAFLANPLSIISINLNLFDLQGAILSGLLAALVYGGRKKLSFWPTLDALTPGLAVFAIALALANLASGNAFGAPTQVPWAIELWGARRHPSQIYEGLAAILILVFVLRQQRIRITKPAGYTFLLFIALYAGTRLFLEAFRGDSLLIFNGLRTQQVIAWLVLAASLWLMARRTGSSAALEKGVVGEGIREAN
jgi:phosphatidylglycerol---prolipoprotein diacylglyceryl transferase